MGMAQAGLVISILKGEQKKRVWKSKSPPAHFWEPAMLWNLPAFWKRSCAACITAARDNKIRGDKP